MNYYRTVIGVEIDYENEVYYSDLVIVKTPVQWQAVDFVIHVTCRLSGHRLCTNPFLGWLYQQVRHHREEFPIRVGDEIVHRYSLWRGWGTPAWLQREEDVA